MALVFCRLRKTFVSKSQVEELCSVISSHFNLKEYEYSVKLTTDRSIRLLNTQFRGIRAATDVLSFPTGLFQRGQLQSYSNVIRKELESLHSDISDLSYEELDLEWKEFRDMGDIVISLPYVNRVAEKRGVKPVYQFTSVLVHGFCHLLGYDHEESLERERMNQVERQCLNTLATVLECHERDLTPLTSQW